MKARRKTCASSGREVPRRNKRTFDIDRAASVAAATEIEFPGNPSRPCARGCASRSPSSMLAVRLRGLDPMRRIINFAFRLPVVGTTICRQAVMHPAGLSVPAAARAKRRSRSRLAPPPPLRPPGLPAPVNLPIMFLHPLRAAGNAHLLHHRNPSGPPRPPSAGAPQSPPAPPAMPPILPEDDPHPWPPRNPAKRLPMSRTKLTFRPSLKRNRFGNPTIARETQRPPRPSTLARASRRRRAPDEAGMPPRR